MNSQFGMIKVCYLQLADNFETKVTTNKVVASGIRTLASFLKTLFCTTVGQAFSMIEQFVVVNVLFYRNFKVNKDGTIVKSERNS